MDTVKEWIPFWPLVVMFGLTFIFGQVLKNKILTIPLAAKYKIVFWLRRILIFILLGFGFVIGLIWPGELIPDVTETLPKAFCMMGSSGASILGFNAFKSYIKTKYKVEIELTGEPDK
jgi:hypothetical protein